MESAKPNNIDWKIKLEKLESFDGKIFTKEVLWNKLHKRLQKKPKNKKAIWYWAAAACLLFALSASFFFLNYKGNSLAQNNLLQREIKSLPQHKTIVDKDNSIVSASLPTQNKLHLHAVIKIEKTNKAINHKSIQPEIVPDKKGETIIQQINRSAIIPMNNTISLVANPPAKKKLRVVHINELGEPVEQSPDIARSAELHSFQFNLANGEAYPNFPITSGISGVTIFKIKTSPN